MNILNSRRPALVQIIQQIDCQNHKCFLWVNRCSVGVCEKESTSHIQKLCYTGKSIFFFFFNTCMVGGNLQTTFQMNFIQPLWAWHFVQLMLGATFKQLRSISRYILFLYRQQYVCTGVCILCALLKYLLSVHSRCRSQTPCSKMQGVWVGVIIFVLQYLTCRRWSWECCGRTSSWT